MKTQLNFQNGTVTTDLVDEQAQASSALQELISYGNEQQEQQQQQEEFQQ